MRDSQALTVGPVLAATRCELETGFASRLGPASPSLFSMAVAAKLVRITIS